MTRVKNEKTQGPGRPRRPETDEAILRAALDLFIDHGMEGASFERVAKRAGVSRATVYRRWSSKEALIARALGRLKEESEQKIGAPWEEMPLNELVAIMVEHGPKAWVDLDARKLLARIVGSLPESPELMKVYWEVYAVPRRAAFTAIVERARREGALPEDTDPEIFQDMLGGAVLYRLLLMPGENTEQELRAYFVRVLEQLGLGEMV